METVTLTISQLDRVHQALKAERMTLIEMLPPYAADALLSFQLLRQIRATPGASDIDAPRRHARRRSDLELPDDLS